MSVIHIVVIAGHRTVVRLEQPTWDVLREIAVEREMSIHELVTEIAFSREARNLTVAIRIYVVDYLRERLRRQLLSRQNKPDARH